MRSSAPQGIPFQRGWYAFDLGRYRPCDGTYCLSPYESLPPIRDLNGSLDWLGPLDDKTDRTMQVHRKAPEARGRLDSVTADAQRLGLRLPPAFIRLMGTPALQDRIPSCTACYFKLGERFVHCPGAEGGYIVRFLNDQQDVLLWYLYLTPGGEECVLVSPYGLDDPALQTPTAEQRTAVINNTFICAPSFEAFVYRFWLENAIWFKLDEGGSSPSFTDEEQRYLAHYQR
jgi:hypothetical protein